MLNAINGTLVGRRFDTLYVDTNGLEWEISVPAISVDSFGPVGSRVRVYAWLQHREDLMKLFGFPDEPARAFFHELLKVEGIGPKQAMKILSGVPVGELSAAVDNEDLARIERVPGVGKKTAQKIVFALKGHLPALISGKGAGLEAGDDAVQTTPGGRDAELVQALVDMGYEARRARDIITKLAKEIDARAGSTDADERERELFHKAILALGAER